MKAASNSKSAQIIIKYKNSVAENSNKVKNKIKQKSKKVNSKKFNNKEIDNKVEILEIEEAEIISDIVQDIDNMEEVEYVQEDFKLEILSLPNDPEFHNQWGIHNTGQEINGFDGTAGIDVNVLPVLEQEDKLSEVLVAVLDTGIDINHYDLKSNMYYEGWNFVEVNSDVTKDSAHGTAIAGIIAAEHNDEGIAGVAGNVKILPVKFIENGVGYTSDAIAGILYAKEKGAKIINCSFGSPNYNQALYDVMKENKDILFVCAAGNSGNYGAMYPAAFELPNVISVASINNRGELSATSNYGEKITIAAPGEDILTTVTDNVYGYDYESGTSMSAAFVTSGIALYAGKYPDKSAVEIITAVKQSARKIDGLDGKVEVDGILDVNELLKQADVWVEEPEVEFPDSFELPKDYEAKAKYLRNTQPYSKLTHSEKEELCALFAVSNETMELYEEAGYNVGETINRAFIKEQLQISVDEVEKLIYIWDEAAQKLPKVFNESTGEYFNAETGISKLYSLVNQLKDLAGRYPDYFANDREIIIDMISKEYEPYQFLYTLVISKFLEVDIEEIIAKKDNYADISIEELDFSEEDKTMLLEFSRNFNVKLSFIVDYLSKNDLTIREFRDNLVNYQAQNNIFVVDDKFEPLALTYIYVPFYYEREIYYRYDIVQHIEDHRIQLLSDATTVSLERMVTFYDSVREGPFNTSQQYYSTWIHNGKSHYNIEYKNPETGEIEPALLTIDQYKTFESAPVTETVLELDRYGTLVSFDENDYDEVIRDDVTLTDTTVYTDRKVLFTGNVTIAADWKDVTLNNTTMTVLGTLNIDSGILTMNNNSNLYVGKDLRVQAKGGVNDDDNDGYGETGGFMRFYGNNNLRVYGNFYTQTPSLINFSETQFDLTFALHGNFYQVGTNSCFNYSNTVKMIFTGIGEQSVYFDRYDSLARLGKIQAQNARKRIWLNSPVYYVELLDDIAIKGSDIKIKELNLNGRIASIRQITPIT